MLGTTSGASVGRGDHTPPWPGRPTGGCRGTPATFHPHFLFGAPKRKRRWSRQKKKRLSLRSYGRGAPSRAAGRGSKPFCPINAAPTRTRAGPFANFRTLYAVLHSEGIGQRLNLTSCSFRAFRFAKRCPGSRGWKGRIPPSLRLPCVKGAVSRRLTEGLSGVDGYFGDGLCRDSHPSLATAGAHASLCAAGLGDRWGFPVFRRGR